MTPKFPILASIPRPLLGGLVIAVTLGVVFLAYGQRQVIPFHTILWAGYASGYTQAQDLVINDLSTWTKVWTQAFCKYPNYCPPTPDVNLTSRTVLAVFMGQEPVSGFAINITQVAQAGPNVLVQVKATVPAPSCGGLLIVLYPSHIVDIPKIEAHVLFNTQTVVRTC